MKYEFDESFGGLFSEADCIGEVKPVESTDRWCHIDLPED